MTRRTLLLVSTALLALAMATFIASRFSLATGVSHFLSAGGDAELAAISSRLAESELARTMILSLEASDLTIALDAAQELAVRLESHPETSSVRIGPEGDLREALYALYFPRRYGFLSSRPEGDLPQRLSDSGLRRTARTLRRELALPEAPLFESVAAEDPLLAFPRLLRRLERARLAGVEVRKGRFVDREGRRAILFVTTRHSAFDGGRQASFNDFLERVFEEVDHRRGGKLILERSGAHRFAAASEASAQADMVRISIFSIAGIAALLLSIFRSWQLLIAAFVPVITGILAATTGTLLLLRELHAITLAFGSTLIGVCIDYSIHLISYDAVVNGPPGSASRRRVQIAVTMGAITTVGGFAGLAWSDIPGVREIALFAVIGVVAALVTAVALLSSTSRPLARPAARRLAVALERPLRALEGHRGLSTAILIAASLLCAAGLPTVDFEDDVFALNLPLDRNWVEEEERVRQRVSRMDSGRFVIARGGDVETALQRNDLVYERLEAARGAGALEGFGSLHTLLWSSALQRRNLAALAMSPNLSERMLARLEEEGFRADAFAAFSRSLERVAFEPLRLGDLLSTPLAPLVSPFHVPLDDGVALLTFLRGVEDAEAIEASLDGLEGVRYFDQQRFLSDLYGHYRAQATRLVLAGLVVVFALLYLRYRRLRLAFTATAPALLAAGTTLALFSLFGVAINLLHMLGLLLVLSIGVDYGIFLVESRAESQALRASILSILIACASTCLAFGLLALSSFPALAALGATIGVGVLLSLVLAPTALAAVGRGEEDARR